ncbi:MAG: class I SAM-dependent methyltransferase [Parachlamydia sp.]|nr:class I SAM-dependent methyltransferase [Parachlamydia sp.]
MHVILALGLIALLFPTSSQGSTPYEQLNQKYEQACGEHSDINEHIPVLYSLANECASVVEIGLRSMNSTWGILKGLAESKAQVRSYLGIDIAAPPAATLRTARRLAESNGIAFRFCQANDLKIDIDQADILFIDSLHTYCHLTYELEKFSPKIRKIICMHDTSAPWGNWDDDAYKGNYSEYPAAIDRTKRGLWPAVQDFLWRHPEWALAERRENNHGFTVLRRIGN